MLTKTTSGLLRVSTAPFTWSSILRIIWLEDTRLERIARLPLPPKGCAYGRLSPHLKPALLTVDSGSYTERCQAKLASHVPPSVMALRP